MKKSEKPWLVFMDRQRGSSGFPDGWDNIIDTDVRDSERLGTALRRHSLIARNGWLGTGIHEAFKKPSDASRWYSAFVTACKASESAFETSLAAPHAETHFELIKPVVVLDGALAGVELSGDGETILTEMSEAAFAFEYRSDTYQRPRYYVDVITLDGFPRYLDLFVERMTAVTDALMATRSR